MPHDYMDDLVQKLTNKYLEIAKEYGDEHARTYIEQVCWKIINDPDQPGPVREGVQAILNSFLDYESERMN